jgi:hypothetical protein
LRDRSELFVGRARQRQAFNRAGDSPLVRRFRIVRHVVYGRSLTDCTHITPISIQYHRELGRRVVAKIGAGSDVFGRGCS